MTKNSHSNDKVKDRSDVKSILETIETMYDTCQNVLNTYTQTSLMLAISIEAEMLLMKLSVMKERWNYHLPFKEACSVDFYDWGKKIEKMSLSFVGPDEIGDSGEALSEFCPSKHFMLDLYTLLSENAATEGTSAYYRELDIQKLVNSQEKILKQITKKWPDYKVKFSDLVANEVNRHIGGILQPIADRSFSVQMTCYEVLKQLSAVLYELYDMPKGVIQRDQFARLADRVVNEQEYGGRKAQQSAGRDVKDLKNTTPEDEWEQRREGEIQASIEFINELKYGRQVFSFLGRNYDINGRYAGLGKFFNRIRRDISTEELPLLIEQLFRIKYLLEDQRQTEMTENTVKPMDTMASPASQKVEVELQTVELPTFFVHDLRVNKEATALMLKLLRASGQFMGRNLTKQEKEGPGKAYAKWKWNHLLKAFTELGMIDDGTTQTEFASFLALVLPGRKTANILQSIYRNCDKMNNNTLADVKDLFMPVITMITGDKKVIH